MPGNSGSFRTPVFDAVINIFTSFGYYDEETDRSILSQSLELTRPGGVFVLETLSRD
jgi:SAM-dependent methyltransferase